MGGRHYLILAAILGLAVVLRTAGVEREGLWLDEGVTMTLARWPALTMLFQPTEPTPALYYVLHRALIPPDAPLVAIRGISIVAGVAAVGLMYALGRAAYGKTAGLVAALLLAVWTAHVDYSQEARAYILQATLSQAAALGTLCYLQARTAAGRRWSLALFAAGNLLAFYTHILAVPFVIATGLIVAAHALLARRPLAEPLLAFAGMALLAVPNVLRVVSQLQHGDTFDWLTQATAGDFIRVQAEVFLPEGLWVNGLTPHARSGLVRWIVIGIAAAALLAALTRYGRALIARPATAVIAAFLAMPAALWALGLVVEPLFMHRAILFAIPGFALLLAGVAAQARRPVVPALFLAGLYLASTLLFGLQREKQDFRGLAQRLQREARTNDIILVCSAGVYPGIRYHTEGRTGGLVLVQSHTNRLLVMEPGGLGAQPRWDEAYLAAELRPRAGLGGPQPEPRSLALQAGQTVFLAEGHCGNPSLRDPVLALLTASGAGLEEIWRAPDRQGEPTDVALSRVTLAAPATWTVWQAP